MISLLRATATTSGKRAAAITSVRAVSTLSHIHTDHQRPSLLTSRSGNESLQVRRASNVPKVTKENPVSGPSVTPQ